MGFSLPSGRLNALFEYLDVADVDDNEKINDKSPYHFDLADDNEKVELEGEEGQAGEAQALVHEGVSVSAFKSAHAGEALVHSKIDVWSCAWP